MMLNFSQVTRIVGEMTDLNLLMDWRLTVIEHFDGGLWGADGWWICFCHRKNGLEQGMITDYTAWCKFLLGSITELTLLKEGFDRVVVEVRETVDASPDIPDGGDGPRHSPTPRGRG